MNDIFYCLWLADAFDAISGLSWLALLGYALGFILCVLVAGLNYDANDSLSEYVNDVFNTLSKHKIACVVLLCPLLLALIFIVALPSKTTIYVGLGASVTTDIVQNPTAQKALQLLNTKLDDLLTQENGGKEE